MQEVNNYNEVFEQGLFSDSLENQHEIEVMMEKIRALGVKKEENSAATTSIREKKNIPEPPKMPSFRIPSLHKKEGFATDDGIAHFKPEDWDGVDTVDDGENTGMEDPRQIIVDFINLLYDFVLYIEEVIAYEITKTLSRGDFEENDVDVVKKYVTWFFAICFARIFIYNWFYYLFFRDENKVKPEFLEISQTKLHNFCHNNFFEIIEPYIKYSFFFPEYFNKIFFRGVPDIISQFMTPTFQYVFLFYFIIYVLYNFANYFRKLFIDVIMTKFNNWVVCLIYGITVLLFVIDLANDFKFSITAKIPLLNIFYFIKKIIYFFIVILICPALGGFLFLFLLVFITLFSVFFADSPFSILKDIMDYANSAKKNIKTETFCEPLTFWEKIINTINYVFEYLYEYSFQVAVMFMILFSFKDYTHNLQSGNLKESLVIVNCVMIAVIAATSFYSFLGLMNKKPEVFTVAAAPPPPHPPS
jgi:hypothetical protein